MRRRKEKGIPADNCPRAAHLRGEENRPPPGRRTLPHPITGRTPKTSRALKTGRDGPSFSKIRTLSEERRQRATAVFSRRRSGISRAKYSPGISLPDSTTCLSLPVPEGKTNSFFRKELQKILRKAFLPQLPGFFKNGRYPLCRQKKQRPEKQFGIFSAAYEPIAPLLRKRFHQNSVLLPENSGAQSLCRFRRPTKPLGKQRALHLCRPVRHRCKKKLSEQIPSEGGA